MNVGTDGFNPELAKLTKLARDLTEEEFKSAHDAVSNCEPNQLEKFGAHALFSKLDGTLTPRSKRLLQGVYPPNLTSPLREDITNHKARVALTFAGQAQDYMHDLERLYQHANARELIEQTCIALHDEFTTNVELCGLHPYGLDVLSWIKKPEDRPPEAYLASSQVSQPLIFITQMAQFSSMHSLGFGCAEISEWCSAITGHSQGIVSAIVASEGHEREDLIVRAANVARYLLWQGVEMQRAFGPVVTEGTAMAAVSGLAQEELSKFLVDTTTCISLHNSHRRFVLSGHPRDIDFVLNRLTAFSEKVAQEFETGAVRRPPQILIERLSVSAPFHSPLLVECMPLLNERMNRLGIDFDSAKCLVPVIRYEDGAQWQNECLVESQTINRVNWPRALNGLLAYEPSHILDLGPGHGVSAITALEVRGYGITVISAPTIAGEQTLISAEALARTKTPPWTAYAPKVFETKSGEKRLWNRFTEKTGYPPIFVPGMTPTTVEAPIIYESANAGFLAELAGGGQTSEAIFRRRADELRRKLKPGAGYILNTLYLDPYLWQLQVETSRLVQKLRQEGHPILGVTISAGLPPKDEALALLREFNALGMRLNSLKLGNADQISHALDIADDFEGLLILQVEGGVAGGHHSFDDLEELLLGWYARIRRRGNCLLTVGGGIGDGDRVAALLSGEWSTKHNLPPMPVDAVYLGTALMACREAQTSDAVKQALVAAQGTDNFVARGSSVGGVRSGRSGLGADIHYLDNHAARTAAYLDTLVGQPELIQENRDEIIEMLAKTAKPYFGDLDTHTYSTFLETLIKRLALGTGAPFQDGCWLDITHRMRFKEMVDRAIARCAGGQRVDLEELDEPEEFLRRLRTKYPLLEQRKLLLEDIRYFTDKVCTAPGKPMPFVPVIDENVRRWYCSDSLWQAHDNRFDADAVLIIPGPVAVKGIQNANESIADTLKAFLAPTLALDLPMVEFNKGEIQAMVDQPQINTPYGLKENPVGELACEPNVTLMEDPEGLELTINHHMPSQDAIGLNLKFSADQDAPTPLSLKEAEYGKIRRFYQEVMPKAITLDPERIQAYRQITKDRGPELPEQLYFALALPRIMDGLLEETLGLNPISLLHVSSEIRHRRFQETAEYTVKLERLCAKDEVSGRRIFVDLSIWSSSVCLVDMQQVFLVREHAAQLPDTAKSLPNVLAAETAVLYPAPRRLFELTLSAPIQLNAFAHISGDLNPIHRDPAIARLAGLSKPIVHGQWTAARACALLAGENRRLLRTKAAFMAPVAPGASLTFTGEVIGRSEGHEVCKVTVSSGEHIALTLIATRECEPEALIFPGQGSQRKGMGMVRYQSSPSVKAVWDRADRHTQERYGFSILEIVRTNPKYITVGREFIEHPDGVLNVTQFTQVALTVLSVAGVADLRAHGACPEHPVFCGHSVGEYSALCAVTDLFPIESLIDVVYQRGITMQKYVERDERGRSSYAMGVIRPHRLGISGEDALRMVEKVKGESGKPLFVVNHNVRDRQYAIAGHLDAITMLQGELEQQRKGADAWVTIPGIDVPFHSPLLREGVPAFRQVLEECIPATIQIEPLLGKYIPNLVARPFELTDDFLDAMITATESNELESLRKDIENQGRAILIELLAWQFASPVRWIETQEHLNNIVSRTIEVGPEASPVLTNMFGNGFRGDALKIECLHASRDFEKIVGFGLAPETDDDVNESESSVASNERSRPSPVPTHEARTAHATLDDEPLSVDIALRSLLALRLGLEISDIDASQTIDGLLGGNSARRNQVLLDLGKEFGVGTIDGAHEIALTELAQQIAESVGVRYRHPGPCLRIAQDEVCKALALDRKTTLQKLHNDWGLGPQRAAAVLSVLAVESMLQEKEAFLDAAAERYAFLLGIELSKMLVSTPEAELVDAGAIRKFSQQQEEHWKNIARVALKAAGLDPALIEATKTEHSKKVEGTKAVSSFDANKHIAFTQSEQWARSDATRWFFDLLGGTVKSPTWLLAAPVSIVGLLNALTKRYSPTASQQEHVIAAIEELERNAARPLPFQNETAVITGAGPGSIAEAIVGSLLAGGATVVVSCSRLTPSRRAHFKSVYRRHAGRGSSLHVVPLNQGHLNDINAFVEWLYEPVFEVNGADRQLTKPPFVPTLFFPFGAMPAEGDPTTIDEQIVESLRVNLIGVEALVGALAKRHRKTAIKEPISTVLPLSPNHGQMGRDGLYAESKLGLEALLQRREAEFEIWGRQINTIGARIGWVRGTGLMAGLDKVYKSIEAKLGITTFSPSEMADLILQKLAKKERSPSADAREIWDFTGGFSEADGLRKTINEALRNASSERLRPPGEAEELPYPQYTMPILPTPSPSGTLSDAMKNAVCVVGFGEIGPYGNARMRWDFERGGKQFSKESLFELAVWCGCIEFKGGAWVDRETGEAINFDSLENQYALSQRIGIRLNESFDPEEIRSHTEVRLETEMKFKVSNRESAEAYQKAEPDFTQITEQEDGFLVTRLKGATVRVPKIDAIDRDIAGQLPRGYDPTRMGFESQSLEQIDPVAIFNLLATADAFRSAGLEPSELWRSIHPARIACTQGSGIGGMRALRRLYADAQLGENKQSDVLQETLINVTAAYPGMMYHGGYGTMINPVSACATAAISVEVATDILARDKADFVVAGAFDDFSREGARGFAEMQATISKDRRQQQGIEPSSASRPCDVRRAGFVEAQGGGTVLLCKFSKALELGLPVYGVIGGAWSASDGIQRSVPAPGPGILRIAAGGESSPLARTLSQYGLNADDIGVVSLHGTSTRANDKNETRLHSELAHAIGRTPELPLYVVAQKAITGHAKGGAAAWQLNGLLQAMNEGCLPGMLNLDEPDPTLKDTGPLLFDDEAIELPPKALSAGLLTSLGFGHVGGAVLIIHPDVLLGQLSPKALKTYSELRDIREREHRIWSQQVLLGERNHFEPVTRSPFEGTAEKEMLLTPHQEWDSE